MEFSKNRKDSKSYAEQELELLPEQVQTTPDNNNNNNNNNNKKKKNEDIEGEQLTRGSNKAQDARLDIHARGFLGASVICLFDVRVRHPNAESYRNLEPQQIYRLHENEKKRQYSSRVLDIEQATFTPLIFTTTGGMGKECLNYHSRLAELIAIRKGEDYAKTISWIRARISFVLLRSALICLRGTRTTVRKSWDFHNTDIEIENTEGAIY